VKHHRPPNFVRNLRGDSDAIIEGMQYMQTLGDAGTQPAFNYGDTVVTTQPVPDTFELATLPPLAVLALGAAVGVGLAYMLGGRR